MAFKVEYGSRRREIWEWYWRAWRQLLWRTHVAVVLVAIGAVVYAKGAYPPSPAAVLLGLAVGCGLMLFMIAYPQLMFRPQTRVLEIDADGISTTRGNRSARFPWSRVLSVSEEDGYLIIQFARPQSPHPLYGRLTNQIAGLLLGGANRVGNAFVVPPRAFASIEERRRFLSFAQAAVAANSGQGR
jgi:hypothetical protein